MLAGYFNCMEECSMQICWNWRRPNFRYKDEDTEAIEIFEHANGILNRLSLGPNSFYVKFWTKIIFGAIHLNLCHMKKMCENLNTLLTSLGRIQCYVVSRHLVESAGGSHLDHHKYDGLVMSKGMGAGLAVCVKNCYEHIVSDEFTVTDQNF